MAPSAMDSAVGPQLAPEATNKKLGAAAAPASPPADGGGWLEGPLHQSAEATLAQHTLQQPAAPVQAPLPRSRYVPQSSVGIEGPTQLPFHTVWGLAQGSEPPNRHESATPLPPDAGREGGGDNFQVVPSSSSRQHGQCRGTQLQPCLGSRFVLDMRCTPSIHHCAAFHQFFLPLYIFSALLTRAAALQRHTACAE